MLRENKIPLLLFLFLLSAYLLTYSGILHSDDEMSMLAVTESLVKRGSFAIDQLAWNQDQAGGIGRYGVDGHLYSKYGWAQPVLAIPLYVLAMIVPTFGLIQTTMLFNSFVTALTGVLLYLLARRLGYGTRVGLLLTLLFSFTTIAWVYAKYFFCEPLTALLLVGTFLVLIGNNGTYTKRALLISGVLLGLAVATKSANAALVPLFYLMPAIGWLRTPKENRPPLKELIWGLTLITIPIAVFIASVGAYNYARFGSPLDAGYNPDETFNGDLLIGVYGLLFTPGKALFLYSPILFSFFLGYPWFFKRFKVEALVVLSIIAVTILLYGKWHAWHGGWGWGPRFLVPTIPFFLIGALPFFDDLLRRKSLILMIPFSILASLSFLVCSLGVMVDFNLYLTEVMIQHPEFRAGAMFFTIMDASRAPIIGQLPYVLSQDWDFVWAHKSNGILRTDITAFFLGGGLVTLTALSLMAGLRLGAGGATRETKSRTGLSRGPLLYTIITVAFLSLTTVVLTVNLLNIAFKDERLTGKTGAGFEMLSYLSTNSDSQDVLILSAPSLTQFVMNFDKARYEAYGILKESPPLRPRIARWIEDASARKGRIWLFQENAPYGDPSLAVETWLDSHASKAENRWFGQSRLLLYSTDSEFKEATQPDHIFGGVLSLDEYSVTEASRGRILGVRLSWRALANGIPRAAMSLRLVDSQGRLVAQRDRELTDSLVPSSLWRAGETVQDRLGITLPADMKPGSYSLMIVVYTVDGTRPLSLADGTQLVPLLSIEVA